ncbi:phage BR0599 family protein [Caulobacter sp. S45]|uniref:baseplate hub domain-containing protein n=1 Tax=Caulobacter sp. S45 TaxID=1641861 RepID=UPI001575ACB4|nr:phage BR0599 family protein [Caulobacter sp. S45]
MKTASTALKDFLLTSTACAHADLYTFTLANGAGVLRYASTDTPVTANGAKFGLGPLCQDGGVDSQRGVHVSTVDITLYADARHTVSGKPFLDFVEDYGLDGAAVTIERAFAASFADMAAPGPVGTYIRFGGKVAGAQTLGATQVVVQAASWLDLLSANLPADTYQTSCLNSLGDARCGVALAGYAVAGSVAVGTNATTFSAALTQSAGWFSLGKVAFTSGANTGATVTVKSFDGAGTFQLVAPLQATPQAGDAFTAYPGCALSMADCASKFANLARFRGQPFIPAPSTGLPT